MPPTIKNVPFKSAHWSTCWDVFVNHACIGYIVRGDGTRTGGHYIFPTFLGHGEISPVENVKTATPEEATTVLVELFKARIKDAKANTH